MGNKVLLIEVNNCVIHQFEEMEQRITIRYSQKEFEELIQPILKNIKETQDFAILMSS